MRKLKENMISIERCRRIVDESEEENWHGGGRCRQVWINGRISRRSRLRW